MEQRLAFATAPKLPQANSNLFRSVRLSLVSPGTSDGVPQETEEKDQKIDEKTQNKVRDLFGSSDDDSDVPREPRKKRVRDTSTSSGGVKLFDKKHIDL